MATNDYGLDVEYVKKNLEQLVRDVASYRPDEMRRALTRLAETCKPENICPHCDGHNTRIHHSDENWCNDCNHAYGVC